MGTRAQFFVGNPEHADNRTWLGCTAWDGHPDGWVNLLQHATNEDDFRRLVSDLASGRDDFCDPSKHGFPFPWVDDLFLTDLTYAWFDGKVMMTWFHRGWISIKEYLDERNQEGRDAYHNAPEALPKNIPSPSRTWDRSAPDSIMVIRA